MIDLAWLNHSPYLAAFAIGLLGGVHCLGMCGGIVGAMGIGRAPESARFPILLAYNLGRISSYGMAGWLAGGLGAAAFSLVGLQQAQQVLALFAALAMIVLGLYLAGIWQGAARLERWGLPLWQWLQPWGKRFIPIRHSGHAFPLGMVWGWLPCGMVYSVLIWSLAAGSAAKGGLLMLAFGLGTLPNLLLMGAAARYLGRWVQQPRVRQVAGLLVIGLGLVSLGRVFA